MLVIENVKACYKMKPWTWIVGLAFGLSGMLYGVAFSQIPHPPDMPHPRVGMCSARIGNTLYLIGGSSPMQPMHGGENDLESVVGSPIVDAFNFDTQTWDTAAAWLNTPRAYATAVTLDDSVYVMGGVDDHGNILSSVEVYDQTKKAWHCTSSMTRRREGAASVVYGDSIFVFGGGGDLGILHREVEVYSLETGSWSPADSTSYGRAFHHAVRIRKYIYIFGGIGSILGTVVGPIKYVERYNPADGSDSTTKLILDPRLFFDVIVVDDSVFAISGSGSSSGDGYYGDVTLLDFQVFGGESQSETKLSLDFPRAGFVASMDGKGNIYIFGGISPDYKLGQLPVPTVEVIPTLTTEVEVVNMQGSESVEFSLSQNYPNPFNPSTKINYQISTLSHVRLTIYDMIGREVRTLVDEVEVPGQHVVQFDAGNLPSGAYIYELQSGNGIVHRKMVLIK